MYTRKLVLGILTGLIISPLASPVYADCAAEYKAAYEGIIAKSTVEGVNNSISDQTDQITKIFFSVFQKCLGDVQFDFKAAHKELDGELACREKCFDSLVKGKILTKKTLPEATACYSNCYAEAEKILIPILTKLEDNNKKVEEIEKKVEEYKIKTIQKMVVELKKGPVIQFATEVDVALDQFKAELIQIPPPVPPEVENIMIGFNQFQGAKKGEIPEAVTKVLEKEVSECTTMAKNAKGPKPALEKDKETGTVEKGSPELLKKISEWAKYYGNLQSLVTNSKKVAAYMKKKGWPWEEKDLNGLSEVEIKSYYECLKPHKHILLNLSGANKK